MKKNQKKVLIFKINLCDKIFSYSSAYALMLESISEAVSSFVVSAARKRGSENRKKRASVFLLSLPPQYFTPHTQCEGIIPPHWYLSICGNYIFSCRVLAEWTLPYIVYLRCGLGAGII
jgi:hypothetical protein